MFYLRSTKVFNQFNNSNHTQESPNATNAVLGLARQN